MIATRASKAHQLPPLTVITIDRIDAGMLKPVRPGQVVDLSRHQVYVTGTQQPVRVIDIARNSCFMSQGFTARVWLPNQRQYRIMQLPGRVALHFRTQ